MNDQTSKAIPARDNSVCVLLSGVKKRLLLPSLILVAVLLLPVACSGGGSSSGGTTDLPPLRVTLEADHVVPGGTLTAHVEGCPRRGPIPSREDRIQSALAPTLGGNHWGPSLAGGKVEFGSTAAYVRGDSTATARPSAGGSADIEFTIKAETIPGIPLVVEVQCSSLLRLNDAGDAIDKSSVEEATVRSGLIAVG